MTASDAVFDVLWTVGLVDNLREHTLKNIQALNRIWMRLRRHWEYLYLSMASWGIQIYIIEYFECLMTFVLSTFRNRKRCRGPRYDPTPPWSCTSTSCTWTSQHFGNSDLWHCESCQAIGPIVICHIFVASFNNLLKGELYCRNQERGVAARLQQGHQFWVSFSRERDPNIYVSWISYSRSTLRTGTCSLKRGSEPQSTSSKYVCYIYVDLSLLFGT